MPQFKKIDIKPALQEHFKNNALMRFLAPCAANKMLCVNKMNKELEKLYPLRDSEFATKFLQNSGIEAKINDSFLNNIPETGPFITVSNHPFGGIDGIMLLSLIARKRPDYKLLVNKLLTYIEPLSDSFLPVNVLGKNAGHSSLKGIKQAFELLNNGCGLGIFPAGEVSSYNGNNYIKDIPWHTAIVKLIKNANVPVIPIFIGGTNSNFFHKIGKINPMFRTLRLPAELFNKSGQTFDVVSGTAITPQDTENFNTLEDYGDYLQSITYALGEAIIKNGPLIKDVEPEPIEAHSLQEDIVKEISANSNCILFETGPYTMYFVGAESNPALIHELGVLREEAFRMVGEGTLKKIDLDSYDQIYKHLILWDREKQQIAGAFRMGMGKDLMEKFGLAGFYTGSLFKLSPGIEDTLGHSIELGRAFLSPNYMKELLPMPLLLRGVFKVIADDSNYKNLIGAVSISSAYPLFVRALIHNWLLKYHQDEFLAEHVHNQHPLQIPFSLADYDTIINASVGMAAFEKNLKRITNGKYCLPTLLKRYIKWNVLVACLNVDPDFSDSLDAFILVKMKNIPEQDLFQYIKSLNFKTNPFADR